MKKSEINKKIKEIKKLKLENNYDNYNLSELIKLPAISGVIELKFKNKSFFMLNIYNDDGVVIKHLWRNKYEKLSLNLWYILTRKEGYFADVGAHTGIYSLIANIDKKENNVISLEPFFINFSRMLSNMRLNKISTNNCFLSALSNTEGVDKIKINTKNFYHSSGGKISIDGNLLIEKKILDIINSNSIVVLNKSDITNNKSTKYNEIGAILISVKQNKNIDNLIKAIKEKLNKKFINNGNILVTRQRHRDKLKACLNEIEKFQRKNTSKEIELAAEDLRMATRYLGSIVGKVDVEEIIGSIFKDFCIGK